MNANDSELEREILQLLRLMNSGADLRYSAKSGDTYQLALPEGGLIKVKRIVARAAWDRGYVKADKHRDGVTICRLSSSGWLRCHLEAIIAGTTPS